MHYSHWQITECCQLPLCSLPHHDGCPCTALTKPLESYIMFQIRSKTMSSRDEVTEFRQQEFTAILCLHGFFCIVFCSFLLPLPQQQHIRLSCNDHEKLKLNHHYLKELTQRLQPTDGIYQTDSITYLTPSALHVMSAAWQVTWGSSMRKHDNKRVSPNNRPQHPRWTDVKTA